MNSKLILPISFLAIMGLNGCKESNDKIESPVMITTSTFSISVETLSDDSTRIKADDRSYIFDLASRRSDSTAHTGRYSLKLTKETPFGFTFDMDSITKGEKIYAEFWCKGNIPQLVITDNTEMYYKSVDLVVSTDDRGWKKIAYSVLAPGNLKDNKLRVYVWNNSNDEIFIDDFKLMRYEAQKRQIAPDMLVKIIVDEESWKKIETKRNEAFTKGVLESSDDDYVKMKFAYKGDTLKGKMRLKGDWLDHLKGDKWSYRIKLKSKYSWRGMKTFSLQTPLSRSYLDEWIAHKVFAQEDVLTTRYGFINVMVNDVDMGVYAYEEHFDKHLLEYNNRREGPIVKFDESRFWLRNKLFEIEDSVYNIPYFYDCKVLPFKENRTANSQTLLSEFEIAQDLMLMYKSWEYPVNKIFDIEKLAKYFALINVTQGYHGIAWHNQRFYFNPVLCVLEPIAFDCYTHVGVYGFNNHIIFFDYDEPNNYVDNELDLFNQYFLDKKFRELYLFYLNKYSQEDFINKTYNSYKDEIELYTELINEEFVYNYDTTFLLNNASLIQKELNEKREKLLNIREPNMSIANKSKYDFDLKASPEIPPYYVSAYIQKDLGNEIQVKVVNDYAADIKIIGYLDEFNISHNIKGRVVKSINSDNNKLDFQISKNVKTLIYKTKVMTETFTVPIYRWRYPEKQSPRMGLLAKSNTVTIKPFLKDDKVIIPRGKHTFNTPVIIPRGYTLEIMAGATIDLKNKAFLLSFSPVKLNGTKGEEIVIQSSDGTSMGFIVLQSNEKSTLTDVVFSQLNVLNYKGWSLTGAVTFYESDVEMQNVTVRDNRCEDALNIIRSEFTMKNCDFDNIYGDAFDSDFSSGTIEFTNFRDIGNDAIDFSGSEININNCKIQKTGDKGISGGEKSHLTVNNVSITNSNIGIASKDNSIVEIEKVKINSSQYGLVVFNKKSEYNASAQMLANNVELIDVMVPILIEQGSVYVEDGVTIVGTEKDLADLFY